MALFLFSIAFESREVKGKAGKEARLEYWRISPLRFASHPIHPKLASVISPHSVLAFGFGIGVCLWLFQDYMDWGSHFHFCMKFGVAWICSFGSWFLLAMKIAVG
jgi:hypothetical protein